MNKKEKNILLILIIILVLVDQIIKIISIAKGNISIQKDKDNISYILINIIASTVIVRYMSSKNSFIKLDSRILLSLTLAGIISNTIDMIWAKDVITYIEVPSFARINLSYVYIAITWIGMAVVLTRFTANRIKEKRSNNGNKRNNS